MRNNKNYTLYWMTGISAVLTVPIAAIIIKNIHTDNVVKAALIMAVFLVLLIATMLLYKYIFGVTVQEITQDSKVTELDRLTYTLVDYRKKYSNLQIMRCLDTVLDQIQRFKRRRNVMLEVLGIDPDSKDSSAFVDLVQTVEDALTYHVEKILNRTAIFDDAGIPDIIRQNITYIDEQLMKNNEILLEFETLITETSRMGEVNEEKDISRLRDVVNAMQSLRTQQEDDIDILTKKYNIERDKNE
ncbi:MAG: hypothetical protein K0S76_2538 [Herbinix sp.]|nr:hypothetical protein [Herbinix sp.]